MTARKTVRFESPHCVLRIERPAPGIVVLSFSGSDVGEFGEGPFLELEQDLKTAPVQLFIDARHGRAATLDVSSEWARWLGAHRDSLRHVSMLTGSRFIQLSADMVRRFSALGERMRLYTDPASFEGALSSSIADATG
jgi:hypothetical protein